MLRAWRQGEALGVEAAAGQAQDPRGRVADSRRFLEHHRGRVPGYVLAVSVVDQRREPRHREHILGLLRLAVRQLLHAIAADDAYAFRAGGGAGVDVPYGEASRGDWVGRGDREEGCVVEARGGGIATNVSGEF